MRIEQSFADKALLAVRAFVRPLPSVVALVDHERGSLRERLAAGVAGVGPFAGMHPLVKRQVAGLAECFAAVGARVGLLARVYATVQV